MPSSGDEDLGTTGAPAREAPQPALPTDPLLRALIDLMPVGVVIAAAGTGRILLANHKAEGILGHPVTGTAYGPAGGYALLTPDGRPFPPQELPLARALERGEVVEDVEIRVRPEESEERSILASASPIRDTAGKITSAIAIFQAITERQRAEEQLREQAALLDLAEDPIFVMDPSGEILFWNRGAERTYGWSRDEAAGQVVHDLLRTEFPAPRAEVIQALQRLGAWEGELRHTTRSGARIVVESRMVGERDAQGRLTRILEVNRDITERQRAEERARFLAEVGEALAVSRDYGLALRNLARLAVGFIADCCLIYLLEPDEHLRPVAVAAADPALEAALREARRLREIPLNDPISLVARAVRAGEPQLLPEIPLSLAEAVVSDLRAWWADREIGGHSLVVVPLTARERGLGAIVLATVPPRDRFDTADLRLAEDLAWRAALAVESARRHDAQVEVARTLQASLLPPELPHIPGIERAARYRPAYQGLEVGGDFYDLFPVDGRWAVVIGDVSGKGVKAATVTALARYTTRAVATYEDRPGRVLSRLNEMILHQGPEGMFITLAFACLRMVEGGARLVLSSGGHPPPLLLCSDGHVEAACRPGVLLGFSPDVELMDDEVNLGPGDALVFYTDGVTEARVGMDLFGEDRLQALLQSCAGMDAEGIAERIERAVVEFQGGVPKDDIAILVLRLPQGDPSAPPSRTRATQPAGPRTDD